MRFDPCFLALSLETYRSNPWPEDIVRMTWYLKDKEEYVARLKDIGVVYLDIIGRNYPAMSAIQIADLVEDEAKVEIEVTAIVPD